MTPRPAIFASKSPHIFLPNLDLSSSGGRKAAYLLFGVLAVAIILRLLFFNGPFGSDDLVYLTRAVQIAEGDWSSANYNGALRYGFNIPAGLFVYLFGVNVAAANLWPLLCSLIEIAAVYLFASRLWGSRAGFYAAVILTFIPLHVAVATRIHTDPIVSCFLTLSFILFYLAEERRTPGLYLLAGLAMGMVFWVKELAVVALFAFALYPLFWRRFDMRWGYVIAGGLIMLFAHFALMYFIAGDPFHAFKVITRQVSGDIIDKGYGEDAVGYYFKYLFFDIKHTWLVGILAAFALLRLPSSRLKYGSLAPGLVYVSFWLLALLSILSFTPISFDPLRFVMKQSNYITLFLAPMALLAGYQLAAAPRWLGLGLLLLMVSGGFLLAALEQQAYQVFTSNSKAAVAFAKAHPGVPIVGSTNNGNIASVYAILDDNPSLARQFRYLNEFPRGPVNIDIATIPKIAYAVIDQETINWGASAMDLANPPNCWQMVQELKPAGFGASRQVVEAGIYLITAMPESLSGRLANPLNRLARPQRAHVYRVNLAALWCEGRNSGNGPP